jgi:hypothetical protein
MPRMSEEEWLRSADPKAMLHRRPMDFSRRKLCLFACACCRRAGELFDADSQKLVEVAEDVADGVANPEQLKGPSQPLIERIVGDAYSRETIGARAAFDAANAIWVTHPRSAVTCADFSSVYASMFDENGPAEQADLLRDIVGNPFRLAVVNRLWIGSNVMAVAQSIYADRVFDRLPILADALEDAGCDNADILNHCRQPSPTEHVRGCWVVDLVLGKS